ncbi:hypothetical protein TRFO_25776 [Tritrichomonas foetus]|uniref:DDE-1 domain-containing protein n=2 Tax=Tritrichomonas foetus TaxID=1144522 RepID=A0A1J4JUC8_9EUKA|nr:hypothetical protein TRFO_07014 [Tritrichomonas foetus]OHT06226.1 hypothetical protein TRFO_25776 [Tritrichomonas foetus]|eukprot:OHT02603.1 hypothetical protein TRFO_07014 [Tritrichomonas foetus]
MSFLSRLFSFTELVQPEKNNIIPYFNPQCPSKPRRKRINNFRKLLSNPTNDVACQTVASQFTKANTRQAKLILPEVRNITDNFDNSVDNSADNSVDNSINKSNHESIDKHINNFNDVSINNSNENINLNINLISEVKKPINRIAVLNIPFNVKNKPKKYTLNLKKNNFIKSTLNFNFLEGKKILQKLSSKEKLEYGELQKISNETLININTLKSWRYQILSKKKTIASFLINKKGGRHRIFSNADEQQIFKSIVEKMDCCLDIDDIKDIAMTHFLKTERDRLYLEKIKSLNLTTEEEKKQLKDLIDSMSDQEVDSLIEIRFHGSYKWIHSFLQRYNFCFTKTKTSKEGIIDEIYSQNYVISLVEAFHQFPTNKIINIDETCVNYVNEPFRMLSIKGKSHSVNIPTQKQSFTSIGIIDSERNKYPPYIINKGKTQRAENKNLKLHDEGLVYFHNHSLNGWVTEDIMLEFLDFLSEMIHPPFCLVLDVYKAHRTEKVMNKAKSMNIVLIFVPGNGTHIYQPLDIAVYGILKAILRKKFRIYWKKNNRIEYNDACKLFIEAWNEIPQITIKKSWEKIPNLQSYLKEFNISFFDEEEENYEEENCHYIFDDCDIKFQYELDEATNELEDDCFTIQWKKFIKKYN